MKTVFNKLAVMLSLVMCFSVSAVAQTSEPIITFHTNIYEMNGESNEFSIVIGMNGTGQYIDVDCGYGPIEYEAEKVVVDADGNVTGTFISCQVSSEGVVKIYGDASQVDYFNASGCYIDRMDIRKLTNLMFLDLSHNELKSLDLTGLTKLESLDLTDNTFSAESPLSVGSDKPALTILDISQVEYLSPSFTIADYPELASFSAYHTPQLTKCDPTKCPGLLRLSIDCTNVETLDVSKNPNLLILNISETRITSIDLSKNIYLTQFYCEHVGSFNYEYKLNTLDLTNNSGLQYLFCSGNNLKELDITKCPDLYIFMANFNYLTSIDVSQCPNLYIVELNKNCMDFATLPLDPGVWNTYYYNQRNMPVDKSYKTGAVLDFSKRVLRESYVTTAKVYSVSESSPESPSELDTKFYTYANGVVTFTEQAEVPRDSVFIEFANTAFPDATLRTDKFKIKTAAEYGKPNKAFAFTGVNGSVSFGVGIQGATADTPKKFYVDFGDNTGNLVEFTATSQDVPATANVTGTKGYGSVIVYVPEGDALTAVDIRNIELYSVDASASASLRTLNLVNTELYNVDLSWNRSLETLDLSNNNISSLTLVGTNGSYEKNALTHINVSNNNLSDITLNNTKAIHSLDLSHNQLETIDFSDADYIEWLNVSYNSFDDIQLDYCSALKYLDISHNNISEIQLPGENNIEYFACNDNQFTLANVPVRGAKLTEENYSYAPQADFIIASKGPGIDLSEFYLDGTTIYAWKKVSTGEALTEGVDYSNVNGLMTFKNIEVGDIYCEMKNPNFPDFNGDVVYKTTPITAAGMPTNVIASFTTVNNNDVVLLSLAAAEAGIAVYFGWDGNENLTQYLLGTTYKAFSAATKAGTEVKVYTYEPTEKITVFSMDGAKLSACDLSGLTDAVNISVYSSGCPNIKLPEGSSNLSELALTGNNITEFDLAKYPALRTATLSDNALTSLNVTNNAYLKELAVAYNNLSNINLNCESLAGLYLDHNAFSSIDLSGVPNVEQLSISNNKLTEINLEPLGKLRVVSLVGNKFTFKTLPEHKSTYAVYYYGSQAPIEISVTDHKVDLSDQAEVSGTPTIYTWYLNEPYVDEFGSLMGENLYVDKEYTIEGGVTTFLKSFNNVMCVMTNAKLPSIYLYTTFVDVVGTGIESVYTDAEILVSVKNGNIVVCTAEAGLPVNLVAANGFIVRTAKTIEGETVLADVTAGIYIVTVGDKACKVVVK